MICVICGKAVGLFEVHACMPPYVPPWPAQPITGIDETAIRKIVREEIQKALEEQQQQQVEWRPPA